MADVEQDWPARVAHKVVEEIDKVKSKTTAPAEKAARGLVLGVALITLVPALLVLALILVGQLFSLVASWFDADVGYVYLIVGLVLFAAGLFLLNKARKPVARA